MNQSSSKLAYTRVLLKLSGEALAESDGSGLSVTALNKVVEEIETIQALGVELAVVVGGGNFLRGEHFAAAKHFDRVGADQMGMVFTMANGIALRTALMEKKVSVRLFSSLGISGIMDQFDRTKAVNALESGHVVIFAGGVGAPFFSTDSAAALRAVEVNADIIFKASTVDGVYSADPKLDPSAKRYDVLNYQTVLEDQLRIMDMTAIALCRENDMPIRVFDMNQPAVMKKILLGETEGTLISN
jgi:uridylate kinase